MLDKKSKLVDDKLKSDNIINLNNSKIEMQKCNNLNENYIEKERESKINSKNNQYLQEEIRNIQPKTSLLSYSKEYEFIEFLKHIPIYYPKEIDSEPKERQESSILYQNLSFLKQRFNDFKEIKSQRERISQSKSNIDLDIEPPSNLSKAIIANQTDDMFDSKYQSSFDIHDSCLLNQSKKSNWVSRKSSKEQIKSPVLMEYKAENRNNNVNNKMFQTCDVIINEGFSKENRMLLSNQHMPDTIQENGSYNSKISLDNYDDYLQKLNKQVNYRIKRNNYCSMSKEKLTKAKEDLQSMDKRVTSDLLRQDSCPSIKLNQKTINKDSDACDFINYAYDRVIMKNSKLNA